MSKICKNRDRQIIPLQRQVVPLGIEPRTHTDFQSVHSLRVRKLRFPTQKTDLLHFRLLSFLISYIFNFSGLTHGLTYDQISPRKVNNYLNYKIIECPLKTSDRSFIRLF